MLAYLADSWFFIALLDRRDSHYRQAHRLGARILGAKIVTHDAVLTEVLAFFAEEGASLRRATAEMVRDTLRIHEVITPDRPLFLRALTRYEQRPDKDYSLVDCMSMVVMEERGIRHVLTNDHHFSQAGFTVINQ